ncbi:hypothetical protein HT105_25230, partial [Bacteroides fragilis]|nr:hypothetical protein [Bacteroides fragilis]
AFIAGGVALQAFDLPIHGTLTLIISVIMLVVAIVLPAVAWTHWAALSSQAALHCRLSTSRFTAR